MASKKSLNLRSITRKTMLVALIPVLLTGLAACSGSDGANGTNGKDGAPGAPGTSATVTNESCMACHTTNKLADISDTTSKTTSLTGLAGVHYVNANNQSLVISNLTMTQTGGFPEINFNLKKNGTNLNSTALSSRIRIYLGDLVPAGTATAQGTYPSDYYERWASVSNPTVDASDSASGNYKITLATAFASASATAPDYSATHPQRLFVRLSGTTEADATITNNTVGILDFMVPAEGVTVGATGAGSIAQYQKAYVTVQTCQKCHGALMEQAAHASLYLDTRACVICHTPIGETGTEMGQGDLDAYLTRFLHAIHSALPNANFTTRLNNRGWGAVTFPQPVTKCVVCHADPSSLTTGSAAAIDKWKTHPTMEACSSCHTTIKFDGTQFVGLDGETKTHNHNDDSQCSVCHIPEGGSAADLPPSVTVAHDPTAAADYNPATDVNAPEFDVTVTMTDPANGTHYVAGETPMVTVTLKNHATGADVDPTVYTTVGAASNAKGVAGGGLSAADLYVYGPRAWALPVLTPGSSTDPALATGTLPTQKHSLLSTTDTKVTRDATGFHYQLQAIPTSLTTTDVNGKTGPGTYMVRFEGGDYGAISDTDYVTSSVALKTFKIGTATDSKKVAGDACVDCHGSEHMHLTGAHPHNAPFDTDQCSGCHDHSGNYADPITNRVHSIHAASVAGDLHGYNHSDVTFPRNLNQRTYSSSTGLSSKSASNKGGCVACHTSGNTTYKVNVTEMPCFSCHADNVGATDHMIQNGGTL